MSLVAAVICLLVMLVISYQIYRDIMSPAFLMLIPWILSFSLLVDSSLFYHRESPAYLYIICAIVVFQLFYAIIFFSELKCRPLITLRKEYYLSCYKKMRLNGLIMYGVICFEIVTMLPYYLLLRRGSSTIGILEYIHKMVFAVFYILVIHLCTCDLKEKKRAKFFLMLQVIPLIVTLMLPTNGRASYFVFIFGALFIYLTFNNQKTFYILKYFFIVMSVFLILFVYVAIRKNHIVEGTTGQALLIQTKEWLTHYLSGSLVTFSRWLPNWKGDFSFGENTFRIIYAILARLGIKVEVSSTFFPFMQIGPMSYNIANVYTIFYTYIIDFGYLGGFVIEAFLGGFYAKIYLRKDSYKIGDVYLYAVFMYALFMQCFADQYVAITSYYLQMYLWYFLFYKCQLLFYRKSRGPIIVKY